MNLPLQLLVIAAAFNLPQDAVSSGNNIDGVVENKNWLEKEAESAVVKLKAKISQKINTEIGKGLVQLEGVHEMCLKQGKEQLMALQTKVEDDVNLCSSVIPGTFDDAKGLVIFGGYSAMWIAGSIWDIFGNYGPCIQPSQSNETFVQCLFDATSKSFHEVEDDGILMYEYALDILSFVTRTVNRVWSCLDQDILASSVQSIVSDAHTCHSLLNSVQ